MKKDDMDAGHEPADMNDVFGPEGILNDEWRACMLRHPDRILLGSGTYNTQYWYEFRYILNRYRDWLPQLPPSVAEKVAWRNGTALFGLNPNIKPHRRLW